MKKATLLILLSLISSLAVAQNKLLPDTIIDRLWQQTCLFPNEKIHLHTDRSLYAVGDTIWFRAYLVNAIDNRQENTSRYVYTELINPFGVCVSRVKIKQDKDSLFYGYLPVIDDLPGGEYSIRAYTRYMENCGDEFFFRKPIHIASPFSNSLTTDVTFEGEPMQKQIKGIIQLKNSHTQETISLENVSIYDEKGKIEYWTEDKQCRFKLSPQKYKQKVIKLEAANFQQFIPVSLQAHDYHVDFLPEGGNLPAAVLSKMAFKAINTYGLSEDMTGIVKDETGKEICSFQTQHAGMGYFSWIPEAGKKYYAECTSKAGVTRKFDLPVAQTNAHTLSVQESRGDYRISVLTTDTTLPTETFTLLIHQRGLPLLAQDFQQKGLIRVDKKAFSSGIIHFVLLSSLGKIISERLAFANNNDKASATIQTDKEVYTQRDKVTLSVTLRDTADNPVQGCFSISVTDNADVLPDSSYTIYTSLLLSSDLKGHIEDPGWYFRADDNERKEGLDLLMLTQGWRQYKLENALTADYKLPEIQPETSLTLTGSVKRLVGNKAIPNAKIQVHIPSQKVLEEINADEQGRFKLSHFEFPDSTRYNIQATTQKDGKNVLLTLDQEEYPVVNQSWPLRSSGKNREAASGSSLSDQPISVEFLNKANQKMNYENGIRTIFMEEVVVTAKKKVYKTPYESIPSTLTIREEDIKKSPMQDLTTFLNSRIPGFNFDMPGMTNGRANVYKRDEYAEDPHSIRIILNDTPIYDSELALLTLQTLRIQDIEQIDYNRHEKDGLAWFPMTGAKFIAITLKKDIPEYDYMPKNINQIQLLGYQEPIAFYSPKYETRQEKESETPDLRTTIFWKPNVVTNKQGEINIEFYTADTSNNSYSVLIEGITNEGKLIREIKNLSIEQ